MTSNTDAVTIPRFFIYKIINFAFGDLKQKKNILIMKKKLFVLSVCILTTVCAFAQQETKRPFDRENFRERETKSDLFSFREHTKSEMRNNRTPISTRQSNNATHRLDSIIGMSEKIDFEYDNNGNMTMFTEYEWDNRFNAWRGVWREVFAYDNNGNVITRISSEWWNNAWESFIKDEFTYDSNGNLITQISSEWWNNAWESFRKEEFTYDSNRNLITEIWSEWRNNAWESFRKVEFAYDSNGNLIRQNTFLWNRTDSTWENFRKEEFIYNSSGNLITQISYFWDSWNEEWINDRRIEFSYDNNGNMITQIASRQDWDNAWRNDWKSEFSYDSNGNMIAEIVSDWRNNAWRNDWKTEFEFDLSVSASDILPNYFFTEEIEPWLIANNKVISMKYYGWIGNTWRELEALTFHYSQTPTNIPNIPENSFTIFPNPVFENFTISGITENTLVSITDLNGRVLLQQMVSPNEQISVGHLSAGVYFVRVNEETVKIVKR